MLANNLNKLHEISQSQKELTKRKYLRNPPSEKKNTKQLGTPSRWEIQKKIVIAYSIRSY